MAIPKTSGLTQEELAGTLWEKVMLKGTQNWNFVGIHTETGQ